MISTRPRRPRVEAAIRSGGAPFSYPLTCFKRGLLAAGCVSALGGAMPAFAESPPLHATPAAYAAPEQDLAIQSQQTDFWTGIKTRETLCGDMGCLPSVLGK